MVLAVIAQVFCSTRLFADKQNGLPKELAATSAPTTPEPLPRRCGDGPGLRVPEATRSAAARSASAKNAPRRPSHCSCSCVRRANTHLFEHRILLGAVNGRRK